VDVVVNVPHFDHLEGVEVVGLGGSALGVLMSVIALPAAGAIAIVCGLAIDVIVSWLVIRPSPDVAPNAVDPLSMYVAVGAPIGV